MGDLKGVGWYLEDAERVSVDCGADFVPPPFHAVAHGPDISEARIGIGPGDARESHQEMRSTYVHVQVLGESIVMLWW